MISIADVFRNTSSVVRTNSPVLLTIVGAIGVVGTAVLSVRAGAQAHEALFLEQSRREEPMTFREEFGLVWRYFIPPLSVAAVTVTAIVASNRIDARRAAAMAAAMSLTDKAFADYKDKVVEVIGPKGEDKVREAQAESYLRNNPYDSLNVHRIGPGDMLMYDTLIGKYLVGDVQTVRKIHNDLNKRLFQGSHSQIMVDDYCSALGIPPFDATRDLFWQPENPLEFDTNKAKVAEDGTPCVVILCLNLPRSMWI